MDFWIIFSGIKTQTSFYLISIEIISLFFSFYFVCLERLAPSCEGFAAVSVFVFSLVFFFSSLLLSLSLLFIFIFIFVLLSVFFVFVFFFFLTLNEAAAVCRSLTHCTGALSLFSFLLECCAFGLSQHQQQQQQQQQVKTPPQSSLLRASAAGGGSSDCIICSAANKDRKSTRLNSSH